MASDLLRRWVQGCAINTRQSQAIIHQTIPSVHLSHDSYSMATRWGVSQRKRGTIRNAPWSETR